MHAAVPLLLEELQEQLTNLVSGTDLHMFKSTIRLASAFLGAFRPLYFARQALSMFMTFLSRSSDSESPVQHMLSHRISHSQFTAASSLIFHL
jgi:hypothetical protein